MEQGHGVRLVNEALSRRGQTALAAVDPGRRPFPREAELLVKVAF